MRRIGIVCAGLVLAVTSACSGGGGGGGASTTTIKASEANARGQAITFQPADFPAGWQRQNVVDSNSDVFAQQLSTCLELPAPATNTIARVDGGIFSGPDGGVVSSSVTFLESAGPARAEMKALKGGGKATGCVGTALATYLQRRLGQTTQATFVGPTVTTRRADGKQEAAFRFAIGAKLTDQTVAVNGDVILRLKGTELLTGTFFSIAKNFDEKLADELMAKLVARA